MTIRYEDDDDFTPVQAHVEGPHRGSVRVLSEQLRALVPNRNDQLSRRDVRRRNRIRRVGLLAGYGLAVAGVCALLSACGGSGGVTPQPTPVVVSTAPSEPTPTPTYPLTERDRLFFELTWVMMTPEEQQFACQSIRGMSEDWLVDFLTSQQPDADYDMRAQVILMKRKCESVQL